MKNKYKEYTPEEMKAFEKLLRDKGMNVHVRGIAE